MRATRLLSYMRDKRRILILGGTAEAVAVAAALENDRYSVTTSLAGRTREPKPIVGRVRIGGFGGTEGLAEDISAERIYGVIDATHPFAQQISANAFASCATRNVPRCVLYRNPWIAMKGDRWRPVQSLERAALSLDIGSTVLLALGRQHLLPFAKRSDVRFVIRSIEPITGAVPPNSMLVQGRPALSAVEEREFLERYRIDAIVSRNSGGAGAYAKIEAARELGLPIIMIARPPPPKGPLLATVAGVKSWVEEL